MVASTRARARLRLCQVCDDFPTDLWIEVLSNLRGKDLGKIACVSKHFRSINDCVWQQACSKRWPEWTSIAQNPETQWRRQYELFELRDKELEAIPDLAAIKKKQRVVNTKHRTILTEWLAEVSWDWSLDSTIVFKAVNYLDHYLARHEVTVLDSFQLIGIACLRAAMSHNQVKMPVKERSKKDLDPARFVYISDRTYTAAEVEERTAEVERETPGYVRSAPNAKMFLRSYWYKATTACYLSREEMHYYTVASFYLQLGLLQQECSAFTASCVAASALSNALEMFGQPAWSPALQHYSAYSLQDLLPCKNSLISAQTDIAADHLRRIWRSYHELHDYVQYKVEWDRVLTLMTCQGKLA